MEDTEYMNQLDGMNGISDEKLLQRFQEAIRIQNEIKHVKGCPICAFDQAQNKAYLEYPDGRIEYAEG